MYKLLYKNILRNKVNSFAIFFGLIIGIICILLIYFYINNEINYEKHNLNLNNIYRVTASYAEGEIRTWAVTPANLRDNLITDFPDIVKNSVRFHPVNSILVKHKNIVHFEKEFCYSDVTVFDIFTYNFIKGNPKSALAQPNSVVISQSIAKKYFGKDDPIGKHLLVGQDKQLKLFVTGIIEDPVQQSHLRFNIIGSMLTVKNELNQPPWNFWSFYNSYTYILLHEGIDPILLKSKFPEFIKKHVKYDKLISFDLQSLKDLHLKSDISGELVPNSSMKHIYILFGLGLAILFITVVNT